MDKVFISYHFDDNGRKLAVEVKDLLRHHGLQHLTGERLGGTPLSEEIKERINQCDGLICLLTERPNQGNADWVRDERATAAANGKRVIALAANANNPDGMYTENERIPYDPANIEKALLKLSYTIGMWKQLSGRKLIIRLEPSQVADLVSSHLDDVVVEYQLWKDDEGSGWKTAGARAKGDAVLAYISGIRTEDTDVELRVRYGPKIYKSRVESQYFRMTLREVAQ